MVRGLYQQRKMNVPEYFQKAAVKDQVGLPGSYFQVECLYEVIHYLAEDPVSRGTEMLRYDSGLHQIYFDHLQKMSQQTFLTGPVRVDAAAAIARRKHNRN